jgi:hypothetical protein
MLGASVSKHFSILILLPNNFGANYYTKSKVNSYFVLQNRTP